MKIKHLLSYLSIIFLGVLAVTNESIKEFFSKFRRGLFIFEFFTLIAAIYLIRLVDSHFKDKGLSKKESTVYGLFSLTICGTAIYFTH
ncbi:hypothetical protein [Fictibacillus barbaricus]|uniref:DUF4181 domain-containing protein n=1 Tax=Fictibacillus barbaricus TaxID=182136 RepID=A0ABU1U4I9_9BACL|nr:hypothetical protein [Fictibacillus barbaricus]MDR7074393.1 hypothetical protein [Fictibacillus barbaricus]